MSLERAEISGSGINIGGCSGSRNTRAELGK